MHGRGNRSDTAGHTPHRERRRPAVRNLFQPDAHVFVHHGNHRSDGTGILGYFPVGIGGRCGLGKNAAAENAAAFLSWRDAPGAGPRAEARNSFHPCEIRSNPLGPGGSASDVCAWFSRDRNSRVRGANRRALNRPTAVVAKKFILPLPPFGVFFLPPRTPPHPPP